MDRCAGGMGGAGGQVVLGVADHDFSDTVGIFVFHASAGRARAALATRGDVTYVARSFGVTHIVVTRDAAVARECRALGLAVEVRPATFARPLVECARSLCGPTAEGAMIVETLL